MCTNIVEPDGPQMAMSYVACHLHAGYMCKAADTYSECVIRIAFLRQQWLRERASVLRLHVRSCGRSFGCVILRSVGVTKPDVRSVVGCMLSKHCFVRSVVGCMLSKHCFVRSVVGCMLSKHCFVIT